MNRKIAALGLILMLATGPAAGQPTVGKQTQYLSAGIGHRAADSSLVSTLSVGVTVNCDTLRGVQAGLVNNVARRQMRGMQIAGISNVASETQGIQVAGLNNISHTSLHGIQLSSVSNVTMGVNRGSQVSALMNITEGRMRGFQVANFNYADTVQGLQLGLFNVCAVHPKGVQVGLVNYSHDATHRSFGLVNIHPDTQMELLFYGGTSSKLNTALRLRNGNLYKMIGIGTYYRGLSEKFSGTVFYRVGRSFRITDRWRWGMDLGYFHIETFEEHSDEVPERLYSIQPRLTADWRFGRIAGLHTALGYESSYYYGGGNYRHRLLWEGGMSFSLGSIVKETETRHKVRIRPSKNLSPAATTSTTGEYGRRALKAAGGVVGVNVFFHLFDRYVLREDYAEVTMHTIGDNFRNAFVWDNDNFTINMIGHPYQGSLYYNAARSTGMSFWQSCPYALGGSLMWEFFGENTPPSINDVFATTAGGIALGEATHRISSLALDDSKRGWPRFWHELAAGLASPIRGLNRLISGEAWRVRPDGGPYHNFDSIPVNFSVSAGYRYLADKGALFRGDYNPCLNLHFDYGNPVGRENGPYDFFDFDINFGFSSNQPAVNTIHLTGQLWATQVNTGRLTEMKVGLFQHFNFYNSEAVKDGTDQVPYRIGEAASFGPGVIYRFPGTGTLSLFEQRVFLSGIMLGGSLSDYFHILERDYNLGSGFSAKLQTRMHFANYSRFTLNADFYRIWTWKGYDEERISRLDDLELANAQGDVGNTALLVLNPRLQVNLTRHLLLDLFGSYYYRRSVYRDYTNVNMHTFEVRAGLTYEL